MLGKLLSGWGFEVNNLDHFLNVICFTFSTDLDPWIVWT